MPQTFSFGGLKYIVACLNKTWYQLSFIDFFVKYKYHICRFFLLANFITKMNTNSDLLNKLYLNKYITRYYILGRFTQDSFRVERYVYTRVPREIESIAFVSHLSRYYWTKYQRRSWNIKMYTYWLVMCRIVINFCSEA